MKKYRQSYLGKDSFVSPIEDTIQEFLDRLETFSRLSYEGFNEELFVTEYDLMFYDDRYVLQSVLDSRVIRSLLLEEYTEGKKE